MMTMEETGPGPMSIIDRIGMIAETWKMLCDRQKANGEPSPSFEQFIRSRSELEHMYTAKALVVLNDMFEGSMIVLLRAIGTLSDARGFTAEGAPTLLGERTLSEYAANMLRHIQHELDVDYVEREAEARTCHSHQQRLRDLLKVSLLPPFEECGYRCSSVKAEKEEGR